MPHVLADFIFTDFAVSNLLISKGIKVSSSFKVTLKKVVKVMQEQPGF